MRPRCQPGVFSRHELLLRYCSVARRSRADTLRSSAAAASRSRSASTSFSRTDAVAGNRLRLEGIVAVGVVGSGRAWAGDSGGGEGGSGRAGSGTAGSFGVTLEHPGGPHRAGLPPNRHEGSLTLGQATIESFRTKGAALMTGR